MWQAPLCAPAVPKLQQELWCVLRVKSEEMWPLVSSVCFPHHTRHLFYLCPPKKGASVLQEESNSHFHRCQNSRPPQSPDHRRGRAHHHRRGQPNRGAGPHYEQVESKFLPTIHHPRPLGLICVPSFLQASREYYAGHGGSRAKNHDNRGQ